MERASAWLVSSGMTTGRGRREEKVGCIAILLASNVGLFVYLSALLRIGVPVRFFSSLLPMLLTIKKGPPALRPPQCHINRTSTQRNIPHCHPHIPSNIPRRLWSTFSSSSSFNLPPASSLPLPILLSSFQLPSHLTPLDRWQFHLYTKATSPQISTHSYSIHQGPPGSQRRYHQEKPQIQISDNYIPVTSNLHNREIRHLTTN